MKMKKKQPREPKENKVQEDEELGLDLEVPSNYENSMSGHPKSMTGFEVRKSPGRMGP
ncbi:hypothetical protein C8P63_1444 [Melghirimyces profundicolus]|uniref:Uncharacterized protein n=2 Tax=Melghirimyces profundicolus TaxID=1242148 RepID=A0A2T6AY34_9BACL|nr:hypothetical protein C8P63_1444 [Melghirimyces profundicolus]